MKEIKLTNTDKVVLIDDDDFDSISAFVWNLNGDGYAIRTLPKVRSVVEGKKVIYTPKIKMHHFILGKPKEGMVVDHKNRNRLDNRKENLRFCTVAQNRQNFSCRVGKSGFRGVYQVKDKWTAGVGGGKTRVEVRGHSTPEEAALKYNELAKSLYGDFAVLNDI